MAFFNDQFSDEEKDRKRNDRILKALTGGLASGIESTVDLGKALVKYPGEVAKAGKAATKEHLAHPEKLWSSIKESVSTPEKAAYTMGNVAAPGPDLGPLAKAVLLSPLMTRRLKKAGQGDKLIYEFDRDHHKVDVTSEDGTVIGVTKMDESQRKGWSEISDREAVLNDRLIDHLKNTPTNVAQGQFHEVKLKDILHFPTLYTAAPHLADTRVVFDTTRGAEVRGSVRTAADGTEEMVLARYPKTDADRKALLETILHEGPAHMAAQKDQPPGFFGTNLKAAGGRYNYHKDMGEIDARLNQYRKDWTNMDKKMVKWETHVQAEKNLIEAAADFSDRMGFTRGDENWTKNYTWAKGTLGDLRNPGRVARFAKDGADDVMAGELERAYKFEIKKDVPGPRKKKPTEDDLFERVRAIDEQIKKNKS